MKQYFHKTISFARSHKIISAVAVLIVLGGGYFWYSSAHASTKTVSYITESASKGTVVASVSGSGQVSPESQVDLKSKVSENVTYVGVKNGQHVKAGTLLVAFNTVDAQKRVRDAQISLDNANLSMQKLQQNGTTLPLDKQQAQDNLDDSYTDAFNAISGTFLDLPGIVSGLDGVLHGTEASRNTQNMTYYAVSAQPYSWQENDKIESYRQAADDAFANAKLVYQKNVDDYRNLTRSSSTASIDSMLQESYITSQTLADAVRSANSFIQLYIERYAGGLLYICPICRHGCQRGRKTA